MNMKPSSFSRVSLLRELSWVKNQERLASFFSLDDRPCMTIGRLAGCLHFISCGPVLHGQVVIDSEARGLASPAVAGFTQGLPAWGLDLETALGDTGFWKISGKKWSPFNVSDVFCRGFSDPEHPDLVAMSFRKAQDRTGEILQFEAGEPAAHRTNRVLFLNMADFSLTDNWGCGIRGRQNTEQPGGFCSPCGKQNLRIVSQASPRPANGGHEGSCLPAVGRP